MTLRIMPVRCNTSNFSEYNPSIEQVPQLNPTLTSFHTHFSLHISLDQNQMREREVSEGKREREEELTERGMVVSQQVAGTRCSQGPKGRSYK